MIFEKKTKSVLLASVAAVAMSGMAHAGVIDLSGLSHDAAGGTLTTSDGVIDLVHSEADTSALGSIVFDISVEHFPISWGSETRIELTHVDSGTTYSFAGDADFGWATSSGVYSFAGAISADLGPADMSGDWNVDIWDDFGDSTSPDYVFLEGSTITLSSDTVPEPAALGLIGLGLLAAGVRRRRRS